MNRSIRLAVIAGTFAIAPWIVIAQTSQGTLSGVTRDTTGALLPNTSITLTNEATGEVRTGKTKSDGTYRLEGLPPGRYTVTFEEPGFETKRALGVVVNPSVVSSYDVVLPVGAAKNEIVEV